MNSRWDLNPMISYRDPYAKGRAPVCSRAPHKT